MCVCVCVLSCPTLCDRQAPLSMGFSRQDYWSGLPFPTPGDLPDSGSELTSPAAPALASKFFTTAPPRNPTRKRRMTKSTEIPITGEDKDLILHSNHTLVYCASSENLALPHTVSFVFSWKCYFKVMAWASLVFLGILCMRASLVTQLAKNPPAMGETWVRALGLEDLLEKREVTHPSILTWRIPWTI